MDASIIESLLLTYQLPAIFFGSFFFGETVVVTAALLAGQGTWSLANVFWLSLAGTVISDSIWFLFGKKIFKLMENWQRYKDQYQSLLVKMEQLTGRRPFLVLLFIKFMYGTRILTILYLSMRQMKFQVFLFFNTIGTLLWLTVMLAIGYLAGRGIGNFVQIIDKVEYGIVIIICLAIIFKITASWLEKKISKK